MNLLEVYIKEIINEEPYYAEWCKGENWVRVTFNSICYGHESIKEMAFTEKRWEEIKEKGYYMG